MVFSSISFLFFFLPVFLVAYYATGRSSWVLFLGSLAFYCVGELRYLPLLLAYVIGNYLFGLAIARFPRLDMPILVAGVVKRSIRNANLGRAGFLIALAMLGILPLLDSHPPMDGRANVLAVSRGAD